MTSPPSSSEQSAAFLRGEGDAWFERNRERILKFNPEHDPACQMLELFQCRPKRVLEIGAANGYRLDSLAKRYGCEVRGTDASRKACSDGAQRYGLKLDCQPAEQLPPDEVFDLVLIQFLMHWLDRDVLGTLIERTAQAIEPSGLLLLGDFLPDAQVDVPYHHLPGQDVKTFKRDYGALFVNSGYFRLIGMISGNHDQMTPSTGVHEADRVGMWLLERKGS